MKFDYGTVIAVAAALIFYLRLIIVQRQKVKKVAGEKDSMPKKNRSASSKAPSHSLPMLTFRSPILLGVGIAVVLLGAGMAAAGGISEQAASLWWIPVTAGILLMSYAIQ